MAHLEGAPLLRPLYLLSLKSRAFLQGVVGKPSLLLGAWELSPIRKLTPRPILELGALLTVSTLFLLSLTLERRRAGLSPRQLLIKAFLFFFPLAIGLWCRTLSSLAPSLPLYGIATLLFLLALAGEGENVQEVDLLNSERCIPLRERVERNVAHIILPHRLDQLPLLLRYYPRATLRPLTRPTGEIRFMALEVDKGEVWKAQERLTRGPAPDQSS